MDSGSRLKIFVHNHVFYRVSPDLRNVVYCSAIRNGGIDEWNHALARYEYNYTVYIAYEKTTLLNALSCTREQWIQKMYDIYMSFVHE